MNNPREKNSNKYENIKALSEITRKRQRTLLDEQFDQIQKRKDEEQFTLYTVVAVCVTLILGLTVLTWIWRIT